MLGIRALHAFRRRNTAPHAGASGLAPEDRDKVVPFMIGKLGLRYDLKNIFDMLRYFMPTPSVPVRWRRRMLAFGSGDLTRAICSTLIAEAYGQIRYPILPEITRAPGRASGSRPICPRKSCTFVTTRSTRRAISTCRHRQADAGIWFRLPANDLGRQGKHRRRSRKGWRNRDGHVMAFSLGQDMPLWRGLPLSRRGAGVSHGGLHHAGTAIAPWFSALCSTQTWTGSSRPRMLIGP